MVPIGALPGQYMKNKKNVNTNRKFGEPVVKSRNNAVGLKGGGKLNTHSSSNPISIHSSFKIYGMTKSRSLEREFKIARLEGKSRNILQKNKFEKKQ
mmetsp:Transcript_7773/g.8887  ORF Transcript_7773/g.8887 Transcript_7773/m.8887 type:complete len:97 (+) Transcript_7773:242-532(+)